MELEKILIVDDTAENLEAAKTAIPNALYASNAKEAIEIIKNKKENLDYVLTDLCMEHPLAGLEVVNEAFINGIIPYTLSAGGSGHNNTTEASGSPYLSENYNVGGKSNPKSWENAIQEIYNPSRIQEAYHKSIRRLRNIDNVKPLDKNVLFMMYVGDNPSIRELLQTHPNRDKSIEFLKT